MAAKKYFIALIIPEPHFGKIEALKQNLFEQFHLKGALRSPAHITLHRPFEWKEEKENKLLEKLKEFKFEQSFKIELKNFAFFEPRVVYVDVLHNIALNNLHQQLTHFAKRELKLYNEAEDMRGFHPHITIAFRDLKKPLFYQIKNTFEDEIFEGEFITPKLTLLKLNQKWDPYFDFG